MSDAPLDDRIYPCATCSVMRSKAEGGGVFTICDACWDKRHGSPDVADRSAELATKPGVAAPDLHRLDIFGPSYNDGLPEGSTVGTTAQFVAVAIGEELRQHLLLEHEADLLAELLKRGAAKVRRGDGGKDET